MKRSSLPITIIFCAVVSLATASVAAQTRRPTIVRKSAAAIPVAAKGREIGATATVVDETLSVLRVKPSLFSESVQRMRRGHAVKILGVTDADGVRFYRVAATGNKSGWVQSDAVFGSFRAGDEERLARLVQASEGFDQIEIANEFFTLYPKSQFRPAILLLYGDLLEEVAAKLTKDSNNRLSRREMAASGAPIHSYFLNFVSLDRYRKLGITFLFNSTTRSFHYDGASWSEIATKFPNSSEAAEAQKRLDSLKQKMTVAEMKKP
jgi:hypothetical protein